MSWNVSYVGHAEKVAEALEKHAEATGMTGQSKAEYDAAAPHMAALVRQNYNENSEYPLLVRISASGHGSVRDGKAVQNVVSVKLEYEYTKVLV